MRTIKWNKQAQEDYYANIDYLLEKWSEKAAQNFIDEVDEILFLLKLGQVEFQETDYLGVRRCVIQPQITLFYKIIDKHQIELLRFWQNNQDDKSFSGSL
jgi:plasmid stabilization system protein ParE